MMIKTNSVKRNSWAYISLILLISIFCLVSFSIVFAESTSKNSAYDLQSLNSKNFKEYYVINEKLRIPTVKITEGGETKEGRPIVFYPDGTANSMVDITLLQKGKYTVEYQADFNGKLVKTIDSFMVYEPLVSVSSRSDYVTYGENKFIPDVKGLAVGLNYGSVFKYNKIIDLNEVGNSNFIDFIITPEILNSADCKNLFIRLTDIYDENNYIEIKLNQSPYGTDVIYASAKASNQHDYFGADWGASGQMLNGTHGMALKGSFFGTNITKPSYILGFSYKSSDMSIRTKNGYFGEDKDYMVDFNNMSCFTKGWNGFSTNEVYLSVSASKYSRAIMSFLATNIASDDLTQNVVAVTKSPSAKIDFGDYTADNYPNALVGHRYKIFDAEPMKRFGGEKLVKKVYFGYGSSTQIDVNITDGYFNPSRIGAYTICYEVTDIFGNVGNNIVVVNAINSASNVNFAIETANRITVGNAGELIPISAVKDVTGGYGRVTTKIIAKNKTTNEEIEITNGEFRPTSQCVYEIIYTLTDYVLQSKTLSYTVTVSWGRKPIFEDVVILPKYFINSGRYELPSLSACDYSSQSKKIINSKIFVKDSLGEREITNGVYEPRINSSKGEVSVIYIAKSSVGEEEKIIFKVPCINTGIDGTLNIAKYFETTKGSFAVTSKSTKQIEFTTTSNSALDFINKILTKSLSVKFQINDSKKSFNNLSFYVTDSVDKSVSLKLTYFNTADGTQFSVNDGAKFNIATKIGADTNLDFVIKDKTVVSGGYNIEIVHDLENKKFQGFPSGFAYLNIALEGVTGATGICMRNINSQPISNATKDMIAPSIVFDGSYGGHRLLNEKVEIGKVKAVDVLNPYSICTLEIKSPSGKFAVAEDGTELNKVSADKAYTLKVTEYGSYFVVYSYKDGSGKSDNFRYAIICVDDVPPVLEVASSMSDKKIGDKITPPTAKISDNYTTTDKIVTYVCVYLPNNTIAQLYKGEYTFVMSGVHTIKYMAWDEMGNAVWADCTVNVA